MEAGTLFIKKTDLPAGSVYTEPSNEPHFAMTAEEPVMVLVTGFGPTDTVYENPNDEPTAPEAKP